MLKRKFQAVLIVILSFNLMNAFAEENDFYTEHSAGWHWYRDRPITPVISPPISPKPINTASPDPIQTMHQLHTLVNRSLDRAILYPTLKNIKNYMFVQQFVTERASLFTERWKQVLLATPQLDYSINHPTSSVGREIYLTQVQQQVDTTIQNFARHQGLFFFYRGDCPYCHRFAPILKDLTDHFGIKVIPISLGGGFLPEYPDSRIDTGQAAALHVQVTPSLFSVNPVTQQIKPVSYGWLSEEDLRRRIFTIATHFKGESE